MMKSLLDSMLIYWILLLALSLGTAGIIYAIWLRDVLI
jgi:uncharacterized oligopeptide transporter (OPT) family protein